MAQFKQFQLFRYFGDYSSRVTVGAWASHIVIPSPEIVRKELEEGEASQFEGKEEAEGGKEGGTEEYQEDKERTNRVASETVCQGISDMSSSGRSNFQLVPLASAGPLPNLPYVTEIRPAITMGARRAFYGTYFFKPIHIIEFTPHDDAGNVSGFAISKLKHINVQNSLYYGEDNGTQYIGYEVAEFELVSRLKSLSISQSVNITAFFEKCLRQVFTAFAFLQSRNWSKLYFFACFRNRNHFVLCYSCWPSGTAHDSDYVRWCRQALWFVLCS